MGKKSPREPNIRSTSDFWSRRSPIQKRFMSGLKWGITMGTKNWRQMVTSLLREYAGVKCLVLKKRAGKNKRKATRTGLLLSYFWLSIFASTAALGGHFNKQLHLFLNNG